MEQNWYFSIHRPMSVTITILLSFFQRKIHQNKRFVFVFVFSAHWFEKASNSQNPICVKMDLK